MKSKNTLNKIKTLLGMDIKFESMELKDGGKIEAESFESGSEVFIVVEDDKVKAPIGEHELVDGSMLIIEEEGIIKEIVSETEEVSEEEVSEEVVEEELAEEVVEEEDVEEDVEEEVSYITEAQLQDAVKELKELIMTYVAKEEEEELAEEVVELSSDVVEEVETINHSPESTVNKKEVNVIGLNRTKNTADRVTSQIYNIKK
tara:strand:+ start:5583 stop:6191 length:609 start_codon:yes stop_codon:yes gene_type:complete